jgi:C-methyltransferase-like protein/methyltransferase family protein/putative zinc binding protein
MPLANALLTADQLIEPEPTFPLELAFCPDCTLAQILVGVSPDALFREYLYFSSFSETMLKHAERLAARVASARRLNANKLVVEIASNDGYLLQFYKQKGIPVLGIEPAANIARWAVEQRGIPTLTDFFGRQLAQHLRQEGHGADVIHANNVLAHVADLNGFVEGVQILLNDGGLAIIEVPYAKDMIDGCEFDTIYHEHLSYFSYAALKGLTERHSLAISDVERLPIHGGSLRLFITHASDCGVPSAATRLLEVEEGECGVGTVGFYQSFGRRVELLRERLCEVLDRLKQHGNRLAAYGASAKGSTLLNYCRIGREVLDFVVDRSQIKLGRFTPGTHLPIYGVERLLEAMPDYVLLLTWNFAEEILAQQEAYRQRGGHFIVPIPDVKII